MTGMQQFSDIADYKAGRPSRKGGAFGESGGASAAVSSSAPAPSGTAASDLTSSVTSCAFMGVLGLITLTAAVDTTWSNATTMSTTDRA